jgi:hypothetical protein
MFCGRIFKELHKAKIRYLAVGGVAVNLHGFSRTTGDLDVLLDWKLANVKSFIKVCKSLQLSPKVPVKLEDLLDPKLRKIWQTEKNMKVFSLVNLKNSFEIVDVLWDEKKFDELYQRAKMLDVGSFQIPIISINDLIKMKKKANRYRDQIDIKALETLRELEANDE